MSSVHNRRVLTSRAASDSKLNKWEGSLIMKVVGLLTCSPNLPQKTPRRKKSDEKGWNDNTKKEHRTGTCWALTWLWLCVLDFSPSGWRLSGSPPAPGSEEYTPVFDPWSDTNWATQLIPSWFLTGYWHNRQRDLSNVGLQENAILHVFCVGCNPFPPLWPAQRCTKYCVASNRHPSDGSSACVAAWVWPALPGHRYNTEERWVCHRYKWARQGETS